MQQRALTRRDFIQGTAALAAPVLLTLNAPPLAAAASAADKTLQVVCLGAHPDDPESGCAGTLSRYADLGHSVTVIYLTRGERGIRDTPLDQAAKIRSAESEKACAILKARLVFFGQIDGATEVTRSQVEQLTKMLTAEKPDVVFAHWPIDTHMDHQVASLLAVRACQFLAKPPQLYFFEVDTGDQSQSFFPDTYVDVTPVLQRKRAALLAHVSQKGEAIWSEHHEIIAKWRGREAGVPMAEAFVRLVRDGGRSRLPGV